jgi:hypothetical protein
MLRKILAGYGAIFGATFRFCLLLAVCLGTGVIVVLPLWTLASKKPDIYSAVFTILLLTVFLVVFFRLASKGFRTNPKAFMLSTLRKVTVICGLALSVYFILSWHRIIALFVLLATAAVYGFLAFGLQTDKQGTTITAHLPTKGE